MTNNTYAESKRLLPSHHGFGGQQPIPTSRASLHRFVRAAAQTRTRARTASKRGCADAVSRAYAVLESVRMPGYSKWQIVYEPGRGKLHFRNAGETKPFTLDARALSFSCGAGAQIIDLRGTVTGRKGVLVAAKPAHNRKLIQLSVKELGAPILPAAIALLAAYPARSTRCAASGTPKHKQQINKKGKAR